MAEFEVTVKCTITKVITVQCDDEQKAWTEPWEWATHEIEIDLHDWEVLRVKCTEQDEA